MNIYIYTYIYTYIFYRVTDARKWGAKQVFFDKEPYISAKETYKMGFIYTHISYTELLVPENGGQNRCCLTKNPTSLQKSPTSQHLFVIYMQLVMYL